MISIGYCCSSTVFMENLQYTFLAITLCNVFVIYVTDSIFIVLIGFDCCYNVFLRYKTLKMKKQNPDLLDQQIDALQRFALCDVVEFHTPLGFILVFIRASMDQTLSFSATLSIATGATVRPNCKSSVEENRNILFLQRNEEWRVKCNRSGNTFIETLKSKVAKYVRRSYFTTRQIHSINRSCTGQVM